MQKHMVGCKFFNHKGASILVAMAMGRLALKIPLEKVFGSKLEGKVLPSALNLVNWLL